MIGDEIMKLKCGLSLADLPLDLSHRRPTKGPCCDGERQSALDWGGPGRARYRDPGRADGDYISAIYVSVWWPCLVATCYGQARPVQRYPAKLCSLRGFLQMVARVEESP